MEILESVNLFVGHIGVLFLFTFISVSQDGRSTSARCSSWAKNKPTYIDE